MSKWTRANPLAAVAGYNVPQGHFANGYTNGGDRVAMRDGGRIGFKKTMSPETVIYKLQRAIESQLNSLTIVITTGVDSMEKYRYILGQINALEATKQEISNLLDNKEQNEGTVIDIGDHKLKDNTTK